ncbi:SprT-like domain-containing protein, partial [Oleiphilus sp. HI0079]
MPSFSAPENLSALQRLAINELERCLSLSERYFQRSFELDAVSFSLRGRSAGQFRAKVGRSTGPVSAKVTFNEIRLNASMLEAYGQRFITETIGHEVAHFIVFQLYGRNVRPHGKEWQSVMSEVLRQ